MYKDVIWQSKIEKCLEHKLFALNKALPNFEIYSRELESFSKLKVLAHVCAVFALFIEGA